MIIFGSYFILMVYVMGMTAYSISDQDREIFIKEILSLHNQARENHGVGRLSWNTDMVSDANNIMKIYNPNIPLPPNRKYGINTSVVDFEDDFKLDANKVFNSWYNTEIYYDYDNPIPCKKTDPFTQIVWRSTDLLCLSLFVGKDHYKVIALYYPRGNIIEEFKKNVKQPLPLSQIPFDPLNKSAK